MERGQRRLEEYLGIYKGRVNRVDLKVFALEVDLIVEFYENNK
jgi:hypothetical protein